MADMLDPQQDKQAQIPPQAVQAIQQAQQQIQQLNAYAKELESKVQALEQEKQAKVVDNDAKRQVAAMQAQVDMEIEKLKIKGEAMLATLKAQLAGANADRSAFSAGAQEESEPAELELEQ
jgi:NADH dehydrogenase FAD-containing subunit